MHSKTVVFKSLVSKIEVMSFLMALIGQC